MNILLIQPPVRDFYRTSIRTQPIGLAYLAASLKKHGHEVNILDCQAGTRRSISIPPELSYLQEFYPFDDRSPFKLYSGYYHFGMGWNEIRQKIEASGARVFGVGSSFTPYHQEALEIARLVKEGDSKRVVVMGGSHVSCDPEGTLKNPLIDYVVLGEGEVRLPFLLEQIEKGKRKAIEGIDGIGWRRDGEWRINPLESFIDDLDSLPHPARELLNLEQYRVRKRRSTMVITSRGCPHRCAYCSSHLVMGNSFRTRSPEAVLREMIECHGKYGIECFDIEDDNFTFDQQRAKRLMEVIIRTFGEGKLDLTAMNGVSFASLDEELLRLMKRAGFNTVNLSYVSAEPSTRQRMRRPTSTIGFDDVLEGAKQAGLGVVTYGIIGMPGQTVEEMTDTLIDLMERQVLIGPSVYYPTPGTPLFDRCRNENVLPPSLLQWRSSAFPIETKDFSRLDLVTLFRLARVINFIKGKMDRNELEEGMTWREIFQELKTKAKVEVEVKDEDKIESQSDALCSIPYAKSAIRYALCDNREALTWRRLLLLLIEERSFFSLRQDREGKTGILREMSSRKVLDYFFERAWGRSILGSQ